MSDGKCTVCGLPESSAGLKFSLNSDGKSYTVTGLGTCKSTDIVIGVYKGLSVTTIGYMAFYNCRNLTSVIIGDSVTSIGDYAFDGCTSLMSVYITDIATWCGIEFKDACSNPLRYAKNLYVGGTLVKNLVIPEGVTSIGSYAFSRCTSLTSVTIPDSVTTIGDDAFSVCYKLVEVINKSSLNITKGSEDYGYLGYYALEIHSGESKIVNVDDYLFITSEGINYLVAYIGNETDLNLPESYNGEKYQIYKRAFYNCTSLTSVVIPDSVTTIGSYAFAYCSSLTSVTIGNSVTTIGERAFRNCTSLTSVTIGNSATSIGEEAFYNCSSLTSVTIGNSVTSIGDSAFSGCYKLVEIINKSSLNITKGSSSYGYLGYYALEIHSGKSKIVNVDDYLFIITSGGINYLIAYVGNETDLTLPENYNGEKYQINENAFDSCSSLTSVVIPDSVTTIGSYAFYNCDSLTSVTIPDSVTYIGKYAFSYCSSLTSVVIGNGITTIGDDAFRNCESLTSVTIPDSVTTIGRHAFSHCESLTSVTIPNSVTTIGGDAFSYCYRLTSIKYRGTQTQWNAISKGSYWNDSTGNYTITYNYDGE